MSFGVNKSLALLHTTFVTVPLFRELAAQHLPNIRIIQLLDDSLLPDVVQAGDVPPSVRARLSAYLAQARTAGADAVLCCCSSIGDAIHQLAPAAGLPVWRIDEAMAEQAVRQGKRIGVLATAPSTLGPTSRLLEQKATTQGTRVHLETLCVEGALAALGAGRTAEHDEKVLAAVDGLASRNEVVVFAQASMARLAPSVPSTVTVPVLTSPVSGLMWTRTKLLEMLGS
jgi:Asp/Glu/hydantoin racemase